MNKRKLGKLALLLVVFGWFCPVACHGSGPQWTKSALEGNMGFQYAICALFLFLSMITALIGIVMFVISSSKKEKNVDAKTTTVLSMIFGLPFFVLMVCVTKSLQILNYGAYIMLAGWIISLVLLIKAKKEE